MRPPSVFPLFPFISCLFRSLFVLLRVQFIKRRTACWLLKKQRKYKQHTIKQQQTMQYEGAEKKTQWDCYQWTKMSPTGFRFFCLTKKYFQKKSLQLKDCWLVHQAAAFAFVQHTISPFFHILVQKELSYIVINPFLPISHLLQLVSIESKPQKRSQNNTFAIINTPSQLD